jgi:hypothetical protein
LAGDPAVVLEADGRMLALAVLTDGSVGWTGQSAPGASWLPWTSLGRPAATVEAVGETAATRADGRLAVMVRGSNGSLWWRPRPTGALWGPWSSLGRPSSTTRVAGAPALAENQDGRLGSFVRGSDGALWHRWEVSAGGAWSAWSRRASGITGDPGVSLAGDGRMRAFASAADGTLGVVAQSAPGAAWQPWLTLGRPSTGLAVTGEPALVLMNGRTSVFAGANDGGLWERSYA